MIELYNEDCYETLCRLEDGKVDLLLQDTPFGVTQNEWDIKPDLPKMWNEWERVTKENGAMIFFATNPFASELITSKLDYFRYDIVWNKSHATGFLNARKMPLRSHELILVFYRKLPTYNPIIKDKPKNNIRPLTIKNRDSNNYGDFDSGDHRTIPIDKEYPKSVWNCSSANKTETWHETQKPVKIMRELISTYSNEGEIVFDGYSGSGTTAIACIEEKRNFIGAELNKEYFDKAMERINVLQSEPKLF